ncbi:hypothetical protein [Spiroplasma culicicola]|uniref:Uncharacterized protein n=1 Tax=Spiroplasma culicicola AES-1 TaxID=1276246 RepID=W6A6F9_9MOLU|nr:hypothetical protein [Spiroplasma culicicola]AHI52546.1 hypothetical protein SCULI_v1c02050 [Spiroplasma culicicola AES-1]
MKDKIRYSDFFIIYWFNFKKILSRTKVLIYSFFIFFNIIFSILLIYLSKDRTHSTVNSIFIFNIINILYLSVFNIFSITNFINIEKETGIYNLERRKKIKKTTQFFSKLFVNRTITMCFISIQIILLSIIFIPFVDSYQNYNLIYNKLLLGYCASYLFDLGFMAFLILITSIFKLRTSIIISSFIASTFLLNPILGGMMPQIINGENISYLTNSYQYNRIYFKSELIKLIDKYPNGFTKKLMDSRKEIENDYEYISNSNKETKIDEIFKKIIIDLSYFSGRTFDLKIIIKEFIEELKETLEDNSEYISLLDSIDYKLNVQNLGKDLLFEIFYELNNSKEIIETKEELNKTILNKFAKIYSKSEIKELNNLVYQWYFRTDISLQTQKINNLFSDLYSNLKIDDSTSKAQLNNWMTNRLINQKDENWLTQEYTFYLLGLLNNVFDFNTNYFTNIQENADWINSSSFGVLSVVSPWTTFNMFQFYNVTNRTDYLTIDMQSKSNIDLYIPVYFDLTINGELKFPLLGSYMINEEYSNKNYDLYKKEKVIYLYINYLVLFSLILLALFYGYSRY